jgi:hypothetical protein
MLSAARRSPHDRSSWLILAALSCKVLQGEERKRTARARGVHRRRPPRARGSRAHILACLARTFAPSPSTPGLGGGASGRAADIALDARVRVRFDYLTIFLPVFDQCLTGVGPVLDRFDSARAPRPRLPHVLPRDSPTSRDRLLAPAVVPTAGVAPGLTGVVLGIYYQPHRGARHYWCHTWYYRCYTKWGGGKLGGRRIGPTRPARKPPARAARWPGAPARVPTAVRRADTSRYAHPGPSRAAVRRRPIRTAARPEPRGPARRRDRRDASLRPPLGLPGGCPGSVTAARRAVSAAASESPGPTRT